MTIGGHREGSGSEIGIDPGEDGSANTKPAGQTVE